jgi:predicted XRE-type DNA-binding protein
MMKKENRTRFTRSSGNVFADIGLPDAQEHLVKAELATHIGRLINQHGLTQTAAGVKLGIAQTDVSRILRGQLSGYSLERLLGIVCDLGNDVEIKVKPARNHEPGRVLLRA